MADANAAEQSSPTRDGFAIYTHAGEEIDFIACAKDGRMRERVAAGLAQRVDLSRFFFADTREPSS